MQLAQKYLLAEARTCFQHSHCEKPVRRRLHCAPTRTNTLAVFAGARLEGPSTKSVPGSPPELVRHHLSSARSWSDLNDLLMVSQPALPTFLPMLLQAHSISAAANKQGQALVPTQHFPQLLPSLLTEVEALQILVSTPSPWKSIKQKEQGEALSKAAPASLPKEWLYEELCEEHDEGVECLPLQQQQQPGRQEEDQQQEQQEIELGQEEPHYRIPKVQLLKQALGLGSGNLDPAAKHFNAGNPDLSNSRSCSSLSSANIATDAASLSPKLLGSSAQLRQDAAHSAASRHQRLCVLQLSHGALNCARQLQASEAAACALLLAQIAHSSGLLSTAKDSIGSAGAKSSEHSKEGGIQQALNTLLQQCLEQLQHSSSEQASCHMSALAAAAAAAALCPAFVLKGDDASGITSNNTSYMSGAHISSSGRRNSRSSSSKADGGDTWVPPGGEPGAWWQAVRQLSLQMLQNSGPIKENGSSSDVSSMSVPVKELLQASPRPDLGSRIKLNTAAGSNNRGDQRKRTSGVITLSCEKHELSRGRRHGEALAVLLWAQGVAGVDLRSAQGEEARSWTDAALTELQQLAPALDSSALLSLLWALKATRILPRPHSIATESNIGAGSSPMSMSSQQQLYQHLPQGLPSQADNVQPVRQQCHQQQRIQQLRQQQQLVQQLQEQQQGQWQPPMAPPWLLHEVTKPHRLKVMNCRQVVALLVLLVQAQVKLNPTSEARVVSELQKRITQGNASLSAHQLSLAMWALAKTRTCLKAQALHTLLQRFYGLLDQASVADVAALVWALPLVTKHYTKWLAPQHDHLMKAVCTKTLPHLAASARSEGSSNSTGHHNKGLGCGPRQMVQLAVGFTRLNYYPGEAWMRHHRAACINAQHAFSATDRVQLRAAYQALLEV